MPFDGMNQLLEAQIRAARERGAFDDLPGHGKPLDLDDLAGLTPEQRFEALLLRTCGEVSPEVALLREIRARREAIARCDSPEERERLRVELRAKAFELSKTWRRRS